MEVMEVVTIKINKPIFLKHSSDPEGRMALKMAKHRNVPEIVTLIQERLKDKGEECFNSQPFKFLEQMQT